VKKILSIIIVNFRSLKYLEGCLTSIYSLKYLDNFEVIIVNNDKAESLEPLLKKFPKIVCVNHGKNIGFGGGVNLGATYAQGEIFFLLNPDSEVLEGDFKKIVEEFEKNKNLGVLGAGLLDENNNHQEWSAGKEKTLLNLVLANLGIKRDKKIWLSEQALSCDWVGGGAMFIRKSLFKSLQGFDENFFMYFEDVDICKRARELGYEVLYFPGFKIKHIGGGSYIESHNKANQKKHFYKSQDYYFQKFYKKKAPFIRLMKKILLKK